MALPIEKTEYTVVAETNIQELATTVNKRLSEGWELQGGICGVNPLDETPCVLQALTRCTIK